MIRARDMEVAMTIMPDEYRRKHVRIRCNDCRNESVTAFHVAGLKCRAPDASCGGSYNTVKIGEAPDADPIPLSLDDMSDALLESLGALFERIPE
jgi:ribosomal protein S27E